MFYFLYVILIIASSDEFRGLFWLFIYIYINNIDLSPVDGITPKSIKSWIVSRKQQILVHVIMFLNLDTNTDENLWSVYNVAYS